MISFRFSIHPKDEKVSKIEWQSVKEVKWKFHPQHTAEYNLPRRRRTKQWGLIWQDGPRPEKRRKFVSYLGAKEEIEMLPATKRILHLFCLFLPYLILEIISLMRLQLNVYVGAELLFSHHSLYICSCSKLVFWEEGENGIFTLNQNFHNKPIGVIKFTLNWVSVLLNKLHMKTVFWAETVGWEKRRKKEIAYLTEWKICFLTRIFTHSAIFNSEKLSRKPLNIFHRVQKEAERKCIRYAYLFWNSIRVWIDIPYPYPILQPPIPCLQPQEKSRSAQWERQFPPEVIYVVWKVLNKQFYTQINVLELFGLQSHVVVWLSSLGFPSQVTISLLGLSSRFRLWV